MVFRGARARRPGLLGTIARTAVISGTAQATSNAMNRRNYRRTDEQQGYAAQQPATYAPPAASPRASAAEDDLVTKLAELGNLHRSGVLSDAEFARAKQQLLG